MSFCAYKALNLSKSATAQQIKQSYFKIAMDTHPDRFKGNKDIFLNASKAYELLKSPEKRRMYDAQVVLNNSAAKPTSPQSHTKHTSSSAWHYPSSKHSQRNSSGNTAYEDYASYYNSQSSSYSSSSKKPVMSNGLLSFTILIGAIVGNLAYASFIRHKWEQTRHLLDTNDRVLQAEWDRAKHTSKDRRIKLEQRAQTEVKDNLIPSKQLEFSSQILTATKLVGDKREVIVEAAAAAAAATNSASNSSSKFI